MFDELDRTIVAVVYDHIERSAEKRVTGSTVWNAMSAVLDIAPVTIPGRLRRLVSHGLLEKDEANSSSRTKVYAPTDAGRRCGK